MLQISLHDVDDVASVDPGVLTINGKPDAEPIVEARRTGVGSSLTRLAEVPVLGRVTDDYGVVSARFGYRIDEEQEYTSSPFSVSPNGERDFLFGPPEGPHIERFSLTPLNLQVGQKLALTVFAEDGDNLNGPHVAHGEVFTFTIVTPEELLAQLYDEEVNLRQRFEQIRREIQDVRDDVALHRTRSEEGRALQEQPPAESGRPAWEEELRQIAVAVAASAERSLHRVRKTHTESRSVEAGFEDIRAKMVNNRVDNAVTLQRIDSGVLGPLNEINEVLYPELDRQVGLFRLANENGTDPEAAMDETTAMLDRLLARMDAVLLQMQDQRKFNELIEALMGVRKDSEKLYEKLKEEQERRIFDLIK